MDACTFRNRPVLKLLPRHEYTFVEGRDPLAFYFWPILGKMYRRRVEMCLEECTSGRRVLEVGFGSGITFLNLHELYEEIHGIDLTADTGKTEALFQTKGIATFLINSNVLEMPYPDNYFDTVLLISILEHLRPEEQLTAFREICRVLKPGGQGVYGVPVERRLMAVCFRLLGYNIREHHFSSEKEVAAAANQVLRQKRLTPMYGRPAFLGPVYQVGHFVK